MGARIAEEEGARRADEVKERMSRFMIRMTGRQQLHQVFGLGFGLRLGLGLGLESECLP